MATVLNCKMCGGDIEVSIGTCLFCGFTMTWDGKVIDASKDRFEIEDVNGGTKLGTDVYIRR